MSKQTIVIVIACIHLALVAGSVSFFARRLPVTEGAQLQENVWEAFRAGKLSPDEDHLVFVNSTRILMPAAMALLNRITGLSWPRTFSIVRLFSILCAYLAFFYFLRQLFTMGESALGLLFLAATIPLTFNNYFELPTEFPETMFFSLGMICILKEYDWRLCLVILIGTLNRETACFLALIFLFVRWSWPLSWRFIFRVAAVGFSWLAPLAWVRWRLGIGWRWQHSDSISHNLPGLLQFFQNFNLFNNYLFYLYLFGGLWLIPFLYWRFEPGTMRRALLTAPIITGVYLFGGGFMDEPREIVPLYVLLVPASLFALRRVFQESAGKDG